ncbi:MAG TPA: protein-disulfide reductase DsbD domain-containing protein [Stellaceae bacterium]|nr:protein-disulfide reductase DsbD domain-containing protein [Stellaceae bacterium]
MGRRWRLIALIAAIMLGGQARAQAAGTAADAASPWYETDQGRVRLIAATASPAPDATTVVLGLQFELAPHWKIYWRSPGDAGYPPQLDWHGSENLRAATIAWPAPERFSVEGLETVGYSGGVVLPIAATLGRAGAPLKLRAHLSYLTCAEICVPHDADLALDLPAQGAGYAALIQQYQDEVPGDGTAAGLKLVAASVRPGAKPALDLSIESKNPLAAPDAFIESASGALFGAPAVFARNGDTTTLRVPLGGDWRGLAGEPLTVTLVDGPRSMAARVTPTLGAGVIDLGTLAAMLGLALLGGLVLNLMPCVLPVLSLKLLAVLPRDGQSLGEVRRGFLGTAFGIVLSFLVLAAATAALKAGGSAVGWGVQFQDPLFLIFIAAVLVLFACNLWGAFEVPLPRGVAAIAERGALGSVATGAFATLLATPCSAPFLGTALGFALAAGPVEIAAIFLLLGIGMALPYLLVAAVPRLARALPRPGRWMIYLRRLLGALLIGTALWLIAILSGELGVRAALAVALLLAFASLALAVLREPFSRWLLLAAAVAGALAVPLLAPAPRAALAAASGPWQAFDPAAIGGLVRDGHVVLVDVTADWCLTCKVNERLVLDTDPVRDDLAKLGVVAMRADWTRPNPAIAAYLARFGRYGIPFNAVYGPAAPGGLPLPELLTSTAVTTALAEAAGR